MKTPWLAYRSRVVVAIAACATASAACKDSNQPAPANDAGPDAGVSSAPATPKTLPIERRFNVLVPGAEPRTMLRYALNDADYETNTELVLSSKTYTTEGKWTKPVDLTFTENWVWSLTKSGDQAVVIGVPFGVTAKARQAGAEARIDPTISAWKTALQGKTFTAAIDQRGYLSNVSFDHDKLSSSPATQFAIDEVKQRWLAYVVPLPDVPVGKGAKWEVITTLRLGTIVMTQTAAYTLTNLTDTTWTFEVTSERNAQKQRLYAVDLPPGVVAELVGSFRKITATLTVDKAWPWPTISAASLAMERHQRQLPPGQFHQWEETVARDDGTLRTTVSVSKSKQSGGPPGPPPAAPPGTAASKDDSNTATKKSPP
ncbi:MAG: hypothetical protein IPL79_00530 [Myxococcales bacterium]|nr:hypothetical protein [Myxococcales bacterium]